MTSVRQEVSLSGSRVEPREEVRSKRRFTEMSQPSHWIALDDVRQLSSKLKAKLMGKANLNVEIIILYDDDIEVVGDTMDTVVAETDDEIDSVTMDADLVVVDTIGISGVILKACVGAMEVTMENQLLKATPSVNVKACGNVGFQQVSLEGNMENQLSNVKQSGNVGSQQFIPTRKSQRIQN
ncbi:hypothetical protein Tco_0630301 [Tanacetum coccineum]